MQPSSIKTIAVLTLVTTSATGCYSTWDLSPKGALQLDGFSQGTTYSVRATDGDIVEVTSDTEFRFEGDDNRAVQFKAESIVVKEHVLTAVDQNGGGTLHVDLSRMNGVQMKNLSIPHTALATLGVIGGGVAAIPVGYVAVIAGFLAMGGSFGGGRPLRVAGKTSPVRAPMMLSRTRTMHMGRARGGDEASRARLLAHWAKEASTECASVPAFLALARDLKALGAPSALLRSVGRAAREEVTHTELCTALSHAQGSLPLLAQMPKTPSSVDLDRESLLKRLALEAFWDGCVAEGAAASVARRSAAVAKDEATLAALQIIARDELEHAQLSKQILAYCMSTAGRAVRDAVHESLEERRDEEERSLGVQDEDEASLPAIDEDFGKRYGLPQREMLQAARIEAWERALAG